MRLKVVGMSAFTSVIAKVISISISFITVPLVVANLGHDRFGVWMIIASLPAFLGFMDLGIGNGVLNAVASANGRSDVLAIRKSLANGIAMLAIASSTFFILFLLIWPWLNWGGVVGLNSTTSYLANEVKLSVLALGIVFLVSIPASLAQRAFLGMQKGFIGGVWEIVGSLLSFLAVILTLKFGGSIPSLVLAMFGVSAIISIVSALHLISKRPDIVPKFADLDKKTMQKFARDGGYFFILQVSAAIAFASDQLIISHNLGLKDVAVFSIYQKLFSPVPMLLSFVLMPLWAAYADAHSKNDYQWIKRILKHSMLIAVAGATIITVVTVTFSENLINLWLGKSIEANILLAITLGVWMIVDSIGRCVAIFLNGVGVLREQLFIILIFVPLCLTLKLLFVNWLGLYGIPLALSIAYLMTHLPGYVWILNRWFNKQQGIIE